MMDFLQTGARRKVSQELSGGTVILMAAAAGLCVASIYYNQPILGILARSFHVSPGEVSLVPIATQVGYAAGLLFLSPLGDRYERRQLIVWTTLALALALAAASLSPSIGLLVAASLGVGALATVAQQVVPMAAQLAPDNQKGRVVGLVMAGLLTGILLSRTVSGVLSELSSWRLMFALASGATAVLAGILAWKLPKSQPVARLTYPQVLWSLVGLVRKHGLLSRAGLVQGLLFAAFVAFWANLAFFLERPPFFMGSSVAGALGIVGIVGVFAAPLAGRLADKGGKRRIILCGSLAVAVSFAVFWLGRESLVVIIAGIVLMDAGMQAAMVSNQARVYALDASARSRLNTVYMTMMVTGGAIGTAIGARAFTLFGWTGVCVMGVCCALLGLALEFFAPAS
jgi:predicted MFS family arabinose efflux permease